MKRHVILRERDTKELARLTHVPVPEAEASVIEQMMTRPEFRYELAPCEDCGGVKKTIAGMGEQVLCVYCDRKMLPNTREEFEAAIERGRIDAMMRDLVK